MRINPDQIDPDAAQVVQKLRRHNHTAYLVGGCVRDLLLGLKPKDFDVATSATPNDIRRVFRNCRIIGRRFRLAHVFFGPKIIEAATFRANPREVDDEEAPGSAETAPPEAEVQPRPDLLIRRDNVFGTEVEDARRRDFTINGLFYDVETSQVIDHVDGMKDLEARLVRTIGDPDIRFREDPVRILRAVKFAARCDLTIEPETYRHMLGHAGEIAKCAQARISEEFYRLLKAGAAKRSMEMLLETRLLDMLIPEMAVGLREPADDAARLRNARFWAYLAALDRSTTRHNTPPSNALLLAAVLFPPLRDVLHPDSSALKEMGGVVGQSSQTIIDRLKASRRDSELSRQILLALRFLFPSSNPNRRRPRLGRREFLDDALRLHEIVSDAEALEPDLAGRAVVAEGAAPPTDDEPLPPELVAPEPRERYGRDHRRPYPDGGARPQQQAVFAEPPSRAGRTPIPGLPPRPPSRPAFLGGGTFGRWGSGD